MNDFEQYLIQLQLNLTLLLVNCSCELGLTMISYDFLAVNKNDGVLGLFCAHCLG